MYSKLLSAGLVMLSAFIPVAVMAQGNLLIVPKRVVFTGKSRIQDLNLANIGKDSATYLISLIQIRMRENGTFENITEPDSGQHFATKNLRIFPRSVTLAPGESQIIKVQLMQVGNLLPGEYRSHIYFRAVPHEIPAGQKEDPKDTENLTVRLIPVFGISIPAIVQIGEDSSHAGISDAIIDLANLEKPQVSMYLTRTGNMSVYGDLFIDYTPAQGKKIRVGSLNGIAVYTPLSKRKITVSLEAIPGVDYHAGELHILYSLQDVKKGGVLAERDLQLH